MYKKLIQDARTIYGWLCDDESKKIFINRLAWLISGDDKYLDVFKNNKADMTYPQIRNASARKLIYIVQELNRPVIIYGGGGIGTSVFKILQNAEIPVKCFWDKDERKQQAGVCNTVTYAPGNDYNGETIIVATGWYTDEVLANLKRLGILDKHIIVPGFTEASLDVKNSYFDKDIIRFKDNEVFVDGGCFNFGTCQILLDKCKTVKSIYAFEPDSNQWFSVQDGIDKSGFSNVHFVKKGLWSKTAELHFTQTFGGGSNISDAGTVSVPVTSIDAEISEPVTFIKMDIEGAELEALKGAAHHIVEDKPKLAICIYHKPQDIFEIPMYIKSLVPQYNLFIRHYSNVEADTVLYAV